MKTHLLCLVVVLSAFGCAPRQAATMWGFSGWYEPYGAGSGGAFEAQRSHCLEQAGVSDDPQGVQPGSPKEDAFLRCMNDAGWCTQMYNCRKPGA